jgi:hypothetical protein
MPKREGYGVVTLIDWEECGIPLQGTFQSSCKYYDVVLCIDAPHVNIFVILQ